MKNPTIPKPPIVRTLPLSRGRCRRHESNARRDAALAYFATDTNPPLTTAEFIELFTPLLKGDMAAVNEHVILKTTGFIEVRRRPLA